MGMTKNEDGSYTFNRSDRGLSTLQVKQPEIIPPVGNIDRTLRVDEIEENPAFLDPVRAYMVARKGKHFLNKEPEEVVKKFLAHMRYFNVNEGSTIAEAIWMSKSPDKQKALAGEAYKIYDALGNVFVNDGVMGAASGVFDYMTAIATSPSTYMGLGAGKLFGLGVSKATAQGVKHMAKTAYKNAMREGLGKKAARNAFDDVYKKAARKRLISEAGIAGAVDSAVAVGQDMLLQDTEMEAGSRQEYNPLQTGLSAASSLVGSALGVKALRARRDFKDPRSRVARTRAARLRALSVEPEFTPVQKEKFADLLEKAYKKKFNGKNRTPKSYASFRASATMGRRIFDEATRDAVKNTLEVNDAGELVIKQGENVIRKFGTYGEDLLQKIIGNKEDGTYLLDLAEQAGMKFPANINEAGKIDLMLRKGVPGERLLAISKMVHDEHGLWLGDTVELIGKNLGRTVSRSFSSFGRGLNVVQGNKLDTDYAHVQGNISKALRQDPEAVVREFQRVTGKKDATPLDVVRYTQNLWKRLIVSAFQTTAVNVQGWGLYNAANAVAEIFQGGALMAIGGMGQAGTLGMSKIGRESLRQGSALWLLQGQKLKNLADPFSTYETYMEVLRSNPDLHRRLFETFSGGIERTANRFGINEKNKLFKILETYANASSKISGVKAQDSVTKSQMFITAIDKHLRLLKGRTFDDVLQKGNLNELDEDVMDAAFGDTMKSVFSYDYRQYTKKANLAETIFTLPTMLGNVFARGVESASNAPGGGFFLPFGRFMNNVVAYASNWNPVTGGMQVAAALARKDKLGATEAFGRSMVGLSAITMAREYQLEQERKGFQWYEFETRTGDVIDITNIYPLSLLMVGARWLNASGAQKIPMTNIKVMDQKPVNPEDTVTEPGDTADLMKDLLKQIAIGQIAQDTQFGNDLNTIFRWFERLSNEGDLIASYGGSPTTNKFAAFRKFGVDTIGKPVGNITAGFLRPFDPFNRLVGTAMGVDTEIDKRLAPSVAGKFGLHAGKYIDNVFDILRGEEKKPMLQTATRSGAIYDPDPISRIVGARKNMPRTTADIVFGMVNKPNWKTSIYTGIPEYDTVGNKVITPLLEARFERLLKDKRFLEGTRLEKQAMVNDALTLIKRDINSSLKYEGGEDELNYRKKKLDTNSFLGTARDRTGIRTPIRQLNSEEVSRLETSIELLKGDTKEDRGD